MPVSALASPPHAAQGSADRGAAGTLARTGGGHSGSALRHAATAAPAAAVAAAAFKSPKDAKLRSGDCVSPGQKVPAGHAAQLPAGPTVPGLQPTHADDVAAEPLAYASGGEHTSGSQSAAEAGVTPVLGCLPPSHTYGSGWQSEAAAAPAAAVAKPAGHGVHAASEAAPAVER